MEVLDLLLTFQFNSRLESFIAKFKTADLAAKGLKGAHSLLVPLLNEGYDPFDTSKYVNTTTSSSGVRSRVLTQNLFLPIFYQTFNDVFHNNVKDKLSFYRA